MTSPPRLPQLLVSVRDAKEARRAAEGGADIIDFKDPALGSLGRADFATINKAVRTIQRSNSTPAVPLSIALGEVTEIHERLLATLPPIPTGVDFAKLGLSQLGSTTDWIDRWSQARSALQEKADRPLRWVAVAYADVQSALAPDVDSVVAAALQTNCAGVLIDTFDKSQGRLLDYLDVSRLDALARQVRSQQMFFAIAGRLHYDDLRALATTAPDVLAVRSAVCRDDDRRSGVESSRVRQLRRLIRETFHRPGDVQPGNDATPNRPAWADQPAG